MLPRSGRAGGRGRRQCPALQPWHRGLRRPRGPESVARTSRPVPCGRGACVWEVCGFAFEVELLPCLNYVRAKP